MSASEVLLVDDDAALLEALPTAIRLRLPDVRIATCDSAALALHHAENREFDAIVTDIKMPGMDGLALLQALRTSQPDTPTLLISGHGEHDLTIQALRGGAYDFIQKPIDRDYFIAALKRALELRTMRRDMEFQRIQLAAHAAQLESTVAARTRQLERANEAKDEFLGLISHEMRTPLTVLNGGIHLLRKRALGEQDRADVLGDMEREGARLLRIVEDLLALAHASLEEGVNAEPLAMGALLGSLAQHMRTRFAREIELRIPDGLPFVRGDSAYVERIVENLVSNSAKYADADHPISIELASDCPGFVSVVVADRGRTVAEHEAERLFERFYRSETTAAKVQGAGIGLTVCRRLAEACGGEITARPRPGGGLIVELRLPLYAAESEACATV